MFRIKTKKDRQINFLKKTLKEYKDLLDCKNYEIKALLQENEELKAHSKATKQ